MGEVWTSGWGHLKATTVILFLLLGGVTHAMPASRAVQVLNSSVENILVNTTTTTNGVGDLTGHVDLMRGLVNRGLKAEVYILVDRFTVEFARQYVGDSKQLHLISDVGDYYKATGSQSIELLLEGFIFYFNGTGLWSSEHRAPIIDNLTEMPDMYVRFLPVFSEAAWRGESFLLYEAEEVRLRSPGFSDKNGGAVFPFVDHIPSGPQAQRSWARDVFRKNPILSEILEASEKSGHHIAITYGAHNVFVKARRTFSGEEIKERRVDDAKRIFGGFMDAANLRGEKVFLLMVNGLSYGFDRLFGPDQSVLFDQHKDGELTALNYHAALPGLTQDEYAAAMILSDYPAMIEGTQSISLALQLGQEFISLPSPWNSKSTEALVSRSETSEGHWFYEIHKDSRYSFLDHSDLIERVDLAPLPLKSNQSRHLFQKIRLAIGDYVDVFAEDLAKAFVESGRSNHCAILFLD